MNCVRERSESFMWGKKKADELLQGFNRDNVGAEGVSMGMSLILNLIVSLTEYLKSCEVDDRDIRRVMLSGFKNIEELVDTTLAGHEKD